MFANFQISAFIPCAAIGLVLIVLSAILLTGNGAVLIAGYNTLPQREKEKFDASRLSKFIGKVLLPVGVLTFGIGFGWSWFVPVYIAAVIVIVTAAIIYANTGNRFKR
ncbi:MAG: DUF3784 domain-containing protein [Oscillospiraceae bacterium]|jgi:hypothetical protein|nr:DUF3784 domain-containing protein [Oscillospiraceae bacterium]